MNEEPTANEPAEPESLAPLALPPTSSASFDAAQPGREDEPGEPASEAEPDIEPPEPAAAPEPTPGEPPAVLEPVSSEASAFEISTAEADATPELPAELGHLEESGYLEEEVLPPEPAASEPAGPAPTEVRLENGVYALEGRDPAGHERARGPDGAEVLVAAYPLPPEAVRALYPHPLLPPLLDSGEGPGGGTLAAHPRPEGATLEAVLGDLPAVARAAVELARFNRYLVARGYGLVGLEPRDVRLGPGGSRLARLPNVRRIGEAAPAEAPRYGAPERAAGAPVTGDEGAYALGALLHHAVAGRPLAEGEMLGEPPRRPGAPQALPALLAPEGGRATPGEALELVAALERAVRPRPGWTVGAASSVGLNPERPANEDSAGYRLAATFGDAGGVALLACVSDGMGGMDKGELASQAAVAAFLEPGSGEGPDPARLRERVVAANRRVVEALEGRSGGCTLTGFIASGREVALAHVGDTRAYRVGPGGVTQLTEDHSIVAMLVKMGMLEPAEARGHPDANKVTRSLGGVRDLPPEHVDTLSFRLSPSERLALVSDGVWGPVEPDTLEVLLAGDLSVQALADALVGAALAAGAPDNATALVLEYEERQGPAAP